MPTRLGNFFLKLVINSPLHSMLGDSFAVITVMGRKTGRLIVTPINIVPVEGVLTAISLRERTWWRNLRHGRPASLRRAGQRLTVRGEIIDDRQKVAACLEKYFQEYPGYARYFGIPRKPDGQVDPQSLPALADQRVIIQFSPVLGDPADPADLQRSV